MPECIEMECFCQICGIALHPHEVGGEFQADFADYTRRRVGRINCTFCHECWNKMMENADGGLDAAKKKRKKLFGDEK